MKRSTLAAQRTTPPNDAAAEHVGPCISRIQLNNSIGATFAAACEVALLQSTLISQQSMPSLAPTHLDLMKATCDLSDGAAAEHASFPAEYAWRCMVM